MLWGNTVSTNTDYWVSHVRNLVNELCETYAERLAAEAKSQDLPEGVCTRSLHRLIRKKSLGVKISPHLYRHQEDLDHKMSSAVSVGKWF